MDELKRKLIDRFVDEVLRRAEAQGVLPTPLDDVAKAAGVLEILDVSDLPEEIAAQKPRAWKKVLGAIFFRERVIFIDRGSNDGRRRLTQAHEIGHDIVPWHRAIFRLDDEDTLQRDVRDLLEREAYYAGARLLFQGNLFLERTLDYKTSLETPVALSDEFGASIHATVRHYVDTHPQSCALLVAGLFPRSDGTVPCFYTLESARFSTRFGHLHFRVEDGLRIDGGKVFAQAYDAAKRGMGVARFEASILDSQRMPRRVVVESFSNGFNVFFLITEFGSARFGRRLRVEAG